MPDSSPPVTINMSTGSGELANSRQRSRDHGPGSGGSVESVTNSPELAQLQDYMRSAKIEDLVLELTESVLRDKPGDPRKFLLGKLEEQIGDGVSREKNPQNKPFLNSIDVPSSHLTALFDSTRAITAEIVPTDTVNIIIQEAAKLLKCDRVSLFVYNPRIQMLVLTASNLAKPIRVQRGQGIAGHVFTTQETINIPDCYSDDRFDPGFDKVTGYTTKGLLTMPIVDFEAETIGVLQAINKMDESYYNERYGPQPESGAEDGEEAAATAQQQVDRSKIDPKRIIPFNQIDELLMGHLTQHAGIALRNAEVYRDAIVASERANGLLHVIQALSQNLGTQSTILMLSLHANELVQADRCTVFLVDEQKDQLWSVTSDSGKEIRIPRTAGIAGECASSNEGKGALINIPDAYKDSRFNQAIDKKTGYHTQSMLCVPIKNSAETKVIGVIQMINKLEFDQEIGTFGDEDVNVLDSFAKFVGARLETSSLMAGSRGKKKTGTSEAQIFESTGPVEEKGQRRNSMKDEKIMEEDDEEEE